MYYMVLYPYKLILLMQITNLRNKNIIVYLVFFLIFLIGVILYKHYGVTLDDEIYRKNGELYYNYIKVLFSSNNIFDLNNLETLYSKTLAGSNIPNHPVVFELILALFIDIFNIAHTKKIYELSHFLNFFIFFLSLIFFYKFICKKFNSSLYGILAVLLIFFTPRFFAETFYNSRDIFFVSLFIFFLYAADRFLNSQNLKTTIYFSLSSALLINAKVIGIIPPIIFLFFYYFDTLSKNYQRKKDSKFILFILPLIIFFMFIFWPYLWIDPLNNFIDVFAGPIREHNELVVINYYLGEYISSITTPWHYRIVWFLFTTPVILIIFFALGFFKILINLIKQFMELDKSNDDLWVNKIQMFDFYLLFILIFIVWATTKFNVSQFGGWRHLYFLYPIVIVFALSGYKLLFKFKFIIKLKNLINLLILLNLVYILTWNYLNHPYQNVFFNLLSKNYAKHNFDLDYWGMSNISSLRYIIENSNKFPIKVGSVSFTSLKESKLMIDEGRKKDIIVVHDLNDADFLIDNYMKRIRNNFDIDKNIYKKYFEIVINGVPINTVYKKNKLD